MILTSRGTGFNVFLQCGELVQEPLDRDGVLDTLEALLAAYGRKSVQI